MHKKREKPGGSCRWSMPKMGFTKLSDKEFLELIEQRRKRMLVDLYGVEDLEEVEMLRLEAVRRYKTYTFKVGKVNGENSETEAIVRVSKIIKRLSELYGFDYRAIVWKGLIYALPSLNSKVDFSVSMRELESSARWFGETLDAYEVKACK